MRNGGGLATTAIEGNTLTEDQVAGILHGTFRAPPSRAYQEREVKNVLDALMAIDRQVMSGDLPAITAELFSDYNRPGARRHSVRAPCGSGEGPGTTPSVLAATGGHHLRTVSTSSNDSPTGWKATRSGPTIPKSDLPGLTPKLAALYARTGPRTLSQDLNRLRDVGLVVKKPHGWQSNDTVIRAFLPPTASDEETQ